MQAVDRRHNQPPEIIDPTDPDILKARLERQYADLWARFVELELGAAQVPLKIETDHQATIVVDWIAQQVKAAIVQAEKTHTIEKAPYLAGGRIVDRTFNDRIKHLQAVVAPIERRVKQYFDAKKARIRAQEEAERRRAEQARQAAIAEAERLAAEAREREEKGDRQGAVMLTQAAEEQQTNAAVAEARLSAPPASVQIHGQYGATGFARAVWTYEIVDLDKVPDGYWTLDEEAIRGAIKDGVRDIPGLRIFQDDRFTIKRC